MGRALAWRAKIAHNVRDSITALLFVLVFNIASAGSLSLADGVELGLFNWWQVWASIVVVSFVWVNPLGLQTISAGADWVQWYERENCYQWLRRKPCHLKTYRLTQIEGYVAGAAWHLRLWDEDGQSRDCVWAELQTDRRIWDLVYNGILHSVAAGAEINSLAIDMLQFEGSAMRQVRADQNG